MEYSDIIETYNGSQRGKVALEQIISSHSLKHKARKESRIL